MSMAELPIQVVDSLDDFVECSEDLEDSGDGGSSSDESDGELV